MRDRRVPTGDSIGRRGEIVRSKDRVFHRPSALVLVLAAVLLKVIFPFHALAAESLGWFPEVRPTEARGTAGRDYHFSTSGDDITGDGSLSRPWATIAKANTLDLDPGDRLLFEGGATFSTDIAGKRIVLTDPSFESGGFSSWEHEFDQGGRSTIAGAENSRSGRYAARLGGDGFSGRHRSVTDLFTVGKTYTLSFWARREGKGKEWSAVGVTFSASDREVQVSKANIRVGSWRKHLVTFTAPHGFDHAGLWMYKSGAGSTIHIDDFEIRESVPLRLTEEDTGTKEHPVIVSSYGTGRAVIRSPFSTAVTVTNASGLEFRDIDLRGNSLRVEGQYGVFFNADGVGGEKYEHIVLDRVSVGNFGDRGILFRGNPALSGFRNVSLTNAEVFGNGWGQPTQGTAGGLEMHGHMQPGEKMINHENVYIGHSRFYHNGSSGAVLGGVRNATIEHCEAYENVGGNAGLGLWVWEADNVLIQYNVSRGNRAPTMDGGGIDLDGGTTNSVVQYNYTYDNGGAGYLLAQYKGASRMGGNVFRYNISENDGAALRNGGIEIFSFQNELPADDTVFHNNVVFASKDGSSAVRFLTGGESIRNVRLYNNVFLTKGNRPLIRTRKTLHESNQFVNNSYHALGGAFRVDWLGTRYSSLAAWLGAAKDQERLDRRIVAVGANPKLAAPGTAHARGGLPEQAAFEAYAPLPDSPLIDSGLDLSALFGMDPGLRDYRDAAIPQGGGFDIGAIESMDMAPAPTQETSPVAAPEPASLATATGAST
jgi:hypothetical protein